jgi:hypothetical protein
MSRGLGRVQRVMLDAFESANRPAFDTSELCRMAYGEMHVQKKHRVAVIRALRALAKECLPSLWVWEPEHEKADAVWYDFKRLPLKGGRRKPVRT